MRWDQALSRNVPEQMGALPLRSPHVANFGTCAGDAASYFSQATTGRQSTSQAPGPDVEQSPVTPAGADNCINAYMSCLCAAVETRVLFLFFAKAAWPIVRNGRVVAESPQNGLLRELSPGPLAPEARIMPLDQAAMEWLLQDSLLYSVISQTSGAQL